MTKRNYEKRFRGYGIFDSRIGSQGPGYGSYKNAPRGKQSMNSILQGLETRKKNKKQPINVKRVIPSKREIRAYCRQDFEFKKLDDFISNGNKTKKYTGVGQAATDRTQLRFIILRDLPFGDILP